MLIKEVLGKIPEDILKAVNSNQILKALPEDYRIENTNL